MVQDEYVSSNLPTKPDVTSFVIISPHVDYATASVRRQSSDNNATEVAAAAAVGPQRL